MENLILFLLSTIGLTFIVVKSKLFKSPRIYFTELYDRRKGKKDLFTKLIWWIDSVINCYMCFSVYGGFACYVLSLYSCNVVLYPLSAVAVVVLSIAWYDKTCRS